MKRRRARRMTLEGARLLLELSRQARWDYPTSFGRPIRWEGTVGWAERLRRDRSSFVSAARFLLRHGEGALATEIAANVWRGWVLAREDLAGRSFLAEVLERGPHSPTGALVSALYGASLFAMRLGDLKGSKKAGERALRAAKVVGDPEALVLATLAISRVAFEEGDYERSLSFARQARRTAWQLRQEFSQAPLFMEAESVRMLGDYDAAASLFRESVALNKRIADKGMVAAELTNLGIVEIHRNNLAAAESSFDESELVEASSPKDPYGRGMLQLSRAMVAFRKGSNREARGLLSRSRATFRRGGLELGKDDAFEMAWLDRELESAPRTGTRPDPSPRLSP